jgi:hypothetical protein
MTNVHAIRTNTIDPTGARSIPNVAIETRMLVDLVKDKPEGTTISYAEMEKEIGRPVTPQTTGYGYLASAKRILLRDHGILIDAEPKVGVRVCTNEEKMLVAGRDVKRARRAVKRSGQKLRSVEYDRLTDEQKRDFNSRMSLAGALELLSAPKAVAKVAQIITDHALPSAKTLELFRG